MKRISANRGNNPTSTRDRNQASPLARDHSDADTNEKAIVEDENDNADEMDFDEEDDDDDNNTQDDSLWNDLKSAWKQHVVAILVALTATLFGYVHLTPPRDRGLFHEVEDVIMIRHSHVNDYQRMANLTFCPIASDALVPEVDYSDMTTLNFALPQELLTVIERYYQADVEQDDYYRNDPAVSTHRMSHRELDCARKQATSSSSHFLKGSMSIYKTPTIQRISRDSNILPAVLSFSGFAAKFINLSDQPKLLFWAGRGGHANAHKLIAEVAPMEAAGTATTPGQSFFLTPVFDSSHQLQRWTVTADDPVLIFEDESLEVDNLSPSLLLKYQMQKLNWSFSKDYLAKSGRPWLSYFPRPPPIHKLWPAVYLGQHHEVSTSAGYVSDQSMQSQQDLRLQLHVTSVVPRVLEIEYFLSEYECHALIQLATKKGLHPSTVDGASAVDTKTRSSHTAWLSRQSSRLVDTIYRRAAHVLQIDESLFRHASPHHEKIASHHSISEDIQIVRYEKGQEYTPHHDFIYPSISNRHQPSRFATLLIYLKAPDEGGETTFPRSLQSTNHDGLSVKPVVGKAALFYNMLPDGNVDDLSQHGSNAVVEGEKWIANLWVWDPIID